MRLPQLAATLWQRASSRAVLPLVSVPVRVLIRPFAPTSATVSHVKHLHDDTKQPDPALRRASEDSAPDDKPKSEAQNIRAASESVSNEGVHEKHQDESHTTTDRRRRPKTEAQIAASRANGQKASVKARAAGFPNLKKSFELQRAAGFPNLRKAQEINRAAGFPGLKKAQEADRASGYLNVKKAYEFNLATDWAAQKKYREAQAATGWMDKFKAVHADLLRDIEAANKRKLAEDPTYIPAPLPDIESRPRAEHPKKKRTVLCPQPGCNTKVVSLQSLKIHTRRAHGGYSKETPHKCRVADCNMYYETKKRECDHHRHVHAKPKAQCHLCDRVLANEVKLEHHLRVLHGVALPKEEQSPKQ